MWKKEETPNPTPAPSFDSPSRTDRSPRGSSSAQRATIGPGISIRGEVTGEEDLVIQGRLDGSVELKQHCVTVGPKGKVKAGIVAREVIVEGMVDGDLKAEERVTLRSTASVKGDITSPRLVLEDGARFRGVVDMGDPTEREKKGSELGPVSLAASSLGASPLGASSSGSSPSKSSSGAGSASSGKGPRTSSLSGGSSGKGKESAAAAAGSRG